MFQVINPTTGQEIRNFNGLSASEAGTIIDAVDHAWKSWKQVSFQERAEPMLQLAKVLENEKDSLAKLMTEEMGKVYKQGVSEVEKCAWVCEYFAENAERFLENYPIETEYQKSYISHQPLGVVLAIMPWNFPLWQVMRFAAPSLMAGNVGVLKHASNVPGCAAAIEDLFVKAGFPKNIFRNLAIDREEIEKVVSNDKVKAVTLTGSTKAGKSVASLAGKYLKKTVLELGGSDPYIVLADADMEKAAELCVTSRMINNGQSCIAAKRFIVEESVADRFEKLVVELMQKKVMGDPASEDTGLGPMARKDLRDDLHKQVSVSVDKGATVLLGAELPERDGFFYPATVLTNVPKDAPAYKEELFGPVASIIRVKSEKEAIEVANSTVYGLGAAIFTQDIKKGEEIAEKHFEAGCCFVNDFVKSDPRLPFGGIKESGYGRELSIPGIKEFTNAKTVVVK